MATKHRCIIVTRWKSDLSRNDPAVLGDLPNGVSVTDITGQPDAIIPPIPNVNIVEIDGLSPAQFAALNAHTGYFTLMSESYEDSTGAIIASTYDDKPSAAQLLAFKSTLQTRFPDVDDDKLTEAGRLAFRLGLTRREILDLLIKRWKRFQKA